MMNYQTESDPCEQPSIKWNRNAAQPARGAAVADPGALDAAGRFGNYGRDYDPGRERSWSFDFTGHEGQDGIAHICEELGRDGGQRMPSRASTGEAARKE